MREIPEKKLATRPYDIKNDHRGCTPKIFSDHGLTFGTAEMYVSQHSLSASSSSRATCWTKTGNLQVTCVLNSRVLGCRFEGCSFWSFWLHREDWSLPPVGARPRRSLLYDDFLTSNQVYWILNYHFHRSITKWARLSLSYIYVLILLKRLLRSYGRILT